MSTILGEVFIASVLSISAFFASNDAKHGCKICKELKFDSPLTQETKK